ncbi:hypothetical protein PMAYCL1PPCAC_25930, partial [Pristionchus mayeri]
SLSAAKMSAESWRTRHDELFDQISEMEKMQKESAENPRARVPMAKEFEDDMSKLRAEKEKLAKEKSTLIQGLIEARKNVAELGKLKKEREEFGEERLKLYRDLKAAHERIEELE